MTHLELDIWEPEETVGKVWHALVDGLDAPEAHAAAAIPLDAMAPRLAVLFRGLGGGREVEIRPAVEEASAHRLSFRRRLGHVAERLAPASFDGHVLRLPPVIDALAEPEANAALYIWLAAAAAHACAPEPESDPLRADLRVVAAAAATRRAVLEDAPGLAALHSRLAAAVLAARRTAARGPAEEAEEALVRRELGSDAPLPELARSYAEALAAGPEALAARAAPRGYRRFRPVPLWVVPRATEAGPGAAFGEEEGAGAAGQQDEEEGGARKARRRKSDLPERRDSLILHKFEAILSWADFLNLNRRVEEDDDTEAAKKAADDMDEITLGQVSQAPATRLKLHLDLSPSDVDRERLSGEHLYPEWDHKAQAYLPDHCRVLASDAEAGAPLALDAAARRRIRRVKRRFEPLRARRVVLPRQVDGDDLDLDAAITSEVDRRASGRGSDRIWRASRDASRDLSVAILLDASRSTESAVTGRAVLDIAREALTALAWGIDGCGDALAIHAFSSLRRDRVFVQECKRFAEPMGQTVEARLGALAPGHYTRLGAAIRHVSADLGRQQSRSRLLLVLTDGKPNDLDHYEGQHGIEDSRMAIREARRAGQAAFGIAIDEKAREWFPRIFGRGGYAVVSRPDRLTAALPSIYAHLVGQ